MVLMETMRGAVLDLGSNSVKFMLAEQRGRTLHVHREETFTTRLGEGVESTRRLTRRAIRDTLDALLHARAAAREFGAEKLSAVATSALRSAENADHFLAPARSLLGHPIQIISGAREARWAYSGICSNPAWARQNVLAMDLGGGSLEFILGQAGKISKLRSLPIGCVRLRELYLPTQPVSADAIERARTFIREKLSPILRWYHQSPAPVIPVGSGGTMFTLTALYLNPGQPPDPARCEGRRLPAHAIRRITHELTLMNLKEIRRLKAVPPSRADVITAGALIYDTFLEASGARSLGCATLGLRYGIWQETIAPVRFTRISREI